MANVVSELPNDPRGALLVFQPDERSHYAQFGTALFGPDQRDECDREIGNARRPDTAFSVPTY